MQFKQPEHIKVYFKDRGTHLQGKLSAWDHSFVDVLPSEKEISLQKWSSSSREPQVFSNTPIKNARILYNPDTDKCEVEDPRGFRVVLAKGNLEFLVQKAHLLHGVIVEECAWCVRRNVGFLVPVSQFQYHDLGNHIDLSSVPLGTRVSLAREQYSCLYLGRYYMFQLTTSLKSSVVVSHPPKHVLGFGPEGTQIRCYDKAPFVSSVVASTKFKSPVAVHLFTMDAAVPSKRAFTKENETMNLRLQPGQHYAHEIVGSFFQRGEEVFRILGWDSNSEDLTVQRVETKYSSFVYDPPELMKGVSPSGLDLLRPYMEDSDGNVYEF